VNHLLSETYNLDRVIQELQTILYNALIVKWDTEKLDAYGRVYKYEQENSVLPKVYDASIKNYKATLYNGQSCFFFVDDDNHPIDDQDHEFTTDVKIVFMLNLADLKTSTERVDADVKRDVTEILRDNDYHFRMNEYIQGIDNVLREFDTSKVKNRDIHPMHVFAINTSWSYSVI
jgi:hypothetical protein